MKFPARAGSGLNHWPFIGVAVLIILLILVTPSLIGETPTASLATRPEIVADHPANATQLYVRGIGTVRYAQISIGVNGNVSWPAPLTAANLTFRNWTNVTDTDEVEVKIVNSTFAVNITAEYVAADGSAAIFIGVLVFHIAQAMLFVASLTVGISALQTPLTNLPIDILLAIGPTAGPPP